MNSTTRPAIFLDRDGVINENRDDYVKSWGEVRFLPGVFDALRRLSESPFAIVLVTNQSAIGRGMLTYERVRAINRRLVAELSGHGGRIDAIYLCPHHPHDRCPCRKPEPGMLYQAAAELDLDLARSFLIGDAISDMQAARAASVQGILVLTGRGSTQAAGLGDQTGLACRIVPDLEAACDYILAASRKVQNDYYANSPAY